MISEKIEKTYPQLFEKELLKEIQTVGKLIQFKKDDILIGLDSKISGLPIILDGAIKIIREDVDNNDFLLYF